MAAAGCSSAEIRQPRAPEEGSSISGLALSPDGKQLAIAIAFPPPGSSPVILWDLASGELHDVAGIDGDAEEVFAYSPDGSLMVIATADVPYPVTLFSLRENKFALTLDRALRLQDLAFRANGEIVAISRDRLQVWHTR
jgi:WD40 repeat protein